MKRTVEGPRGATSRPVWGWALVLLTAMLVFSACNTGPGIGASESWSGVAVQEGTESAFVGTRDGRIIQLVLRPNSRGIVQPTPGSVFDIEPRPEGQDSRSRVGGAFYATPTIADGMLYAGSYQGFVYSMLAADTGEGAALSSVNAYEIAGDNLAKGIAGAVVHHNGLLVVAAAEDINLGRLYVLDAEALNSGANAVDVEHCHYPPESEGGMGRMWTTPLVVDGIAYIGDLEHLVHAIDIQTCQPVWDAPAELGGGIVATPVAIDGKLYIGAFDRKMYAVDMATGAVEELFEATSWFWATPAANGSMLYAPNLDGILYAYDVATRQLMWQYDQGGSKQPILADPVVVNGNVVLASDSGTITVLDPAGARVDDFAIADDTIRAPLTASSTGTVYVRTLDELVAGFVVSGNSLEKDWEFRLEGF